jgi:hypothetical protein
MKTIYLTYKEIYALHFPHLSTFLYFPFLVMKEKQKVRDIWRLSFNSR